MARYLQEHCSKQAKNCTVQLSYAIGMAEPTSLYVYADGEVRNDIANWVRENVDLRLLQSQQI